MIQEIMVPMRDSVRLRTKIAKTSLGRSPVLLIRGYDTDSWIDVNRFVRAGYICVSQSPRGHIGSEGAPGIDNRLFDDAQDGYDALTWISQQPWCDGNIAIYGIPTTVPHSGWLRQGVTQTSKQLFHRTSIPIRGSACTVITARFNLPTPPGASTEMSRMSNFRHGHKSGPRGTGMPLRANQIHPVLFPRQLL